MRAFLVPFLLLMAAPAPAAEIRITFPAVRKMMADQLFTVEGKKYVRGDKTKRCDFAYLENPQVGEWQGQLVVKAKFSGRTAFDVFGRCMGVGDAFDLTIAATPIVKRGVLVLTDVKVDTGGKDSYYIRKVRKTLGPSLEKEFGLDITGRARELLEQKDPKTGYLRELSGFDFRQVKLTKDAVILDVDFAITIR
ncbi:hypothetical protein [uncultured Paludibaculum sp.]|uniref:hypothetical protein n=1 Tax=uncultured Paludibaculum sp. TaxID=1765020 RepID=UPI002AAAA327|nr:hypothetical protein [uncultured Paludibaculum sp.]